MFFPLSCRVEDEAVLDRGAAFVKHVCDEEEVEGEREHSRCTNVASLTQSENSSFALHLWFILHYYEDSQKEKCVNQALRVYVWVCTQQKMRQISPHRNKITSLVPQRKPD